MTDKHKTKAQLVEELSELRQQVAELDVMATECQRAMAQIQHLNHLKENLLKPNSLEQKLSYITDGIVEIFDADFARIWMTKPGDLCDAGCMHAKVKKGPHVCRYRDRCLHLMVSSGRYTHTNGDMHGRVPFGCYKIGRVAAGEDPKFITNDVTRDPQVHNHDWAKELGLVSFAGYRLLSTEGKPIGVLALFSQHTISAKQDALLEDLANTTAQVIQTARAEQTLRQSEATLRSMINAIPESAFLMDTKGTILAVNETTAQRLGVSVEKMMGNNVYDFAPPDVAASRKKQVEKVVRAGKPVQFEDKRQDRYIFNSLNPLFDATGKVVSLAIFGLDITERKQVEEALRESEERYRSLFTNNHSTMLLIDPETANIIDANPAACSFYGYSHKELTAKTITDINTLSKEEVFQEMERAKLEKRRHFLFRHRLASGEIRDVEVFSGPIKVHGRQLLYSIVHDITERVRIEETLRQRNHELALLNQFGQTFVSTLDLDQVLNLVLEGVRRSLEVVACSAWLVDPDTGELVCRQVTDPQSEIVRGWRVAPGQGLVGWVAQHGQSLNVPDTQADERHFKGVDQKTGLKLRSILSAPLRVKKGVIGVLQVVDETKNRFTAADLQLVESLATTAAIAIENAQLYEAAQEMQRQTQQDAETKAILLEEVNHRVKNNLAAIAGMLYVEKRHAKKTGEQRTYQGLVEDLVNRIEGLATVHRLLSASQWSPLLLKQLTEQVIQSALQTLPPDKWVNTNVLSTGLIQVTPKQANNLAMVINELATNVVKYGLLERQTVQITVRMALEDKTVLFEFRDDGPGFPEEVLRSERQNVGLYLVQNIVSGDMRGEIKLDNDQGAVVAIQFPYRLNDERSTK